MKSGAIKLFDHANFLLTSKTKISPMIKNCFKIILVIALMNLGCSAQKNSLVSNIETFGNKQPIEDSILQKLQTENDLVISYAVENFAWVRSMDFHIITQKNNEWTGYIYHKNLMTNAAGSPTSITANNVDKTACDSLLNYITDNKAWTIKGDSGNGFLYGWQQELQYQ